MSQHMNMNDRQIISAGLKNGDSLGTIAKQIGIPRDPRTSHCVGQGSVWAGKQPLHQPEQLQYRETLNKGVILA